MKMKTTFKRDLAKFNEDMKVLCTCGCTFGVHYAGDWSPTACSGCSDCRSFTEVSVPRHKKERIQSALSPQENT